jgi:hypothetical protein
LALISLGIADLSNGVHEVDAQHPFIDCELDFSREIMKMPDEGGQDLSVPGRGLWANGVDDMLSEVGVKPGCRHACGGWRGRCDGWWGRQMERSWGY